MTTIDERTILVTGATDGHGRALAERLARTGATVLIHGRDEARGEQTIAKISKLTGNDRLEWYQADFADLNQVHDMAARIRDDHTQLHMLISNAGIGNSVDREESKQGYELRFAVNYLAGFALIRDLYPLLNQTAKFSPTRVISVSSVGQVPIDFDDVMLTKSYNPRRAYCQSKLAQIMMTFDLAERCKDTNVAAVALHPSTYMNTKMVTTPMSTIEDGVAATLHLANAVSTAAINGKYFDILDEAEAHPQAYDRDARTRLRELSEELTGE
jgi:NAD(P)-dependent dehydrogenase (short-subunit alcohol dehydrogenase family)